MAGWRHFARGEGKLHIRKGTIIYAVSRVARQLGEVGIVLLAGCLVLVLPTGQFAQDYTSGPGLALVAPEAGYGGMLGSMAGNTVAVPSEASHGLFSFKLYGR